MLVGDIYIDILVVRWAKWTEVSCLSRSLYDFSSFYRIGLGNKLERISMWRGVRSGPEDEADRYKRIVRGRLKDGVCV